MSSQQKFGYDREYPATESQPKAPIGHPDLKLLEDLE
jgi:hypothetical protein